MHIVAVANNKSDEEIITKYNEGVMPILNFTDDQLKLIEDDLIKHHPSATIQHAMDILREFQNRDSHQASETAEVT